MGMKKCTNKLCRTHLKKYVLVAGILLYGVLACAFFMPRADWTIGECLYFAVVVVTTVGYGDYLPETPSEKVFTVVFIHLGLSIVVLALGIVQDLVVARSMKVLHTKNELGVFDRSGKRTRERNHALAMVLLYAVCVLAGTVVFSLEFEAESESESPWVDGFYMTVVTMSTVGFGDLTPISSSSRFFGCLLMLIGIPVFVGTINFVNRLIYDDPNEPEDIATVKGALTEEKFNKMSAFVNKLRAKTLTKKEHAHGGISKFEFFVFILCENGRMKLEDMEDVLENFKEHDITGTQGLTRADIETSPEKEERQSSPEQPAGSAEKTSV